MSESEIINNIFSEALHQLERRWRDDTASAQVRGDVPPEDDAVEEEIGDLEKEEADSEEVEDRLTDMQLAVPDEKESMVALKRDDDDGIPDIPPEIAPAAEEDDLDSLLEDLAKSADPDGGDDDAFSGLLGEDEGGDFGDDFSGQVSFGGQLVDGEESERDSSGNSLDDLLEHALGLADTPEGGDLTAFADHDEGSDMMQPAFEQDDDQPDVDSELDNLLGSSSDDGEEDDSIALSDDLFASEDDGNDLLPGQDLSDLLDGDDEAGGDVVRTVKVPEPSIPVVEDADEELERKLSEMGLGDDNLLHNRFSAGKEKLLRHLLARFEALARHKLEPLPTDQVNLVRSVNLRVEIDLKFGEFTTSGDDDSLFKLDV